ncbi:hypothetical protein [Halobellus rufus]|uniref:hypothetical protein n=1 Tax=Halobellus rufus TaxID=1448860 RepID=UPI0006787A2C|nr:hypothetical protein [Halobellus rufus]
MVEGALVLVVLLFAVVAPFVLYALVRSEHDQRETMDRRDAERTARRDTDRPAGRDPADRTEWSTDRPGERRRDDDVRTRDR